MSLNRYVGNGDETFAHYLYKSRRYQIGSDRTCRAFI